MERNALLLPDGTIADLLHHLCAQLSDRLFRVQYRPHDPKRHWVASGIVN
jgi:hypothetical protein